MADIAALEYQTCYATWNNQTAPTELYHKKHKQQLFKNSFDTNGTTTKPTDKHVRTHIQVLNFTFCLYHH